MKINMQKLTENDENQRKNRYIIPTFDGKTFPRIERPTKETVYFIGKVIKRIKVKQIDNPFKETKQYEKTKKVPIDKKENEIFQTTPKESRFQLWKDQDKIYIAKVPQISISEIVNVFIKEYLKTGKRKYGIDDKLEPWPFQDTEAKEASQEGGASVVRKMAKKVRTVDRELTRAGKFVKGIPDHLNIDSPDGALELCIEEHLRELNDGKIL